MTKPIAVIEMGTPPQVVIDHVGRQAQWFQDALGWSSDAFQVYRPEMGDPLPEVDQIACAIITGSWSMVTESLDWSETVAGWIRDALPQQLPLLGVCYGHQLMAHALGGLVADNPNGPEQGLHWLNQAAVVDPLLDGFPQQFPAWLCHYQSVLTTPPNAEVLLGSPLDTHQMIRYNERCYSVQFHPEFSLATMNACYLAEQKPLLSEEAVSEPELAREILRRFVLRFA